MRPLLIALIGLILIPAVVWADSNRTGRRLDAIQSGRLYDPILTPQLNPNFEFSDPNAEAMFLHQLRQGRVVIEEIPEQQRQYFQMQLERNR